MQASDIKEAAIEKYRTIKHKKTALFVAAAIILAILGPWNLFSSTSEDKGWDIEPDPTAVNRRISNADSDLESTKKMERIITNFMREWNLKGASVAVTRNGRLVYAKGFGWADEEAGEKMDAGHIMRMASVSKLITAAGIMKLCEEGRIKLSDKVFGPKGILSDSIYADIRDKRFLDITVEHLLRHDGGFTLKYGDPMFCSLDIARKMDAKAPADKQTMIRFVLSRELGNAPGRRVSYSNVGYLILSQVIEEASGTDYITYIKENILRPAGCYDMHMAYNTSDRKYPHEARYYEPENEKTIPSCDGSGQNVPKSDGGNDVRGLLGAGGWVGSPAEIARFVCAIDGLGGTDDILKPSSVQQMTKNVRGRLPIGWINTYGRGNWTRSGSFAGTSAMVKRQKNGTTWVFVTNTSTWAGSKFPKKIENMMSRALSSVNGGFPDRDMFSEDYKSVAAGQKK